MDTAGPREHAISVRAITHRYGDRLALDAIGLDVPTGEIFAMLGPNGSGKTTLFHILATLLRPSAGTALVLGSDVVREPAIVRRRIGVAFQSPSLDRKLTCEENLVHHGHLYGVRGATLRQRINELLERLALSDRRRDRIETLSGGLQRRVDLARALLHRPRVLLLDEPSTGLDPAAKLALWQHLEALQRTDGVTIVLATHMMDEADRCGTAAILNAGRVITVGPPERLKSEVGGNVVAVEASGAETLAPAIRERFGVEVRVTSDTLKIEKSDAENFAARLIEAFPGRIRSVRIGRPTLEDVFLHHTGRAFDAHDLHAGASR